MTYNVTATRWEHGWELDIEGVGVTQSHTLADAERMVRDYLALDLDAPPESFDVTITPDVPGATEVADLRRRISDLVDEQRKIAARSRSIAHRLRKAGLNGADTAAVLGVSPQRVSQLLKER